MTDTTAFGLAFAAVWGGLGAYFVYLHVLETRLARDLAALSASLSRGGSHVAERKLK